MRSRRRRKQEIEEVVDIEETTEEVQDEEEAEAVEEKKPAKTKKIRKKREKALIFDDNAPEFIMRIRDTETAIEAIKERQETIGKNTYEIGHILLHIKKNKLYKPRYKSFTQFCQSQEVGYSASQASNLIAVVKEFDKDTVEEYGMTKLLPITRLKDEDEKKKVLDKLEEGELTDVKSVEKVVKEMKSYPSTPTRVTKKALSKAKEKKGVQALVGKTVRLYMVDDDDSELKSIDAIENAKNPCIFLPITEGVAVELRTTDGVLWVAKFVSL